MFNLFKYFQQPLWLKHRHNKILLAGVAVLLAALLLATAYFFNFYPYRDSLVKRAPADAVLYWHFNLLNGTGDYDRLNLSLLFNSVDQWFNWPTGQFQQKILPLAKRELAIVMVPINQKNEQGEEELILGKALLINLNTKAKDELAAVKVLPLPYVQIKNQLVIADSELTLNKITGVSEQNNLKNRPSVKKGLKKVGDHSLAKGYADVEFLNQYYNQTLQKKISAAKENIFSSDLNFLLARLSVAWLEQQGGQQIYFALKKEAGGFSFRLLGPDKNSAFGVAKSRLIKFVPPDTLIALVGFDWQQLISSLEKTFSEVDPGLNSFKNNYEKLYRFSWEQDLAPLLSGEGELLVVKNAGQKNEFILSAAPPNADEPKMSKLENIVKEYLAYHRPTEQKKVLPDKSQVTELIADPSQFNFQNADSENLKIKFIKEDKLNFEFLYSFLNKNRLVFSNSLEKFKIFQRNQQTPAPDWLNFNQATKTSFFERGQEAALINLKEIKLNDFLSELMGNFNWLTMVNTREGVKGSIY